MIPLKTGRSRPKSAKDAERQVDVLSTVLGNDRFQAISPTDATKHMSDVGRSVSRDMANL